MSIVCDQRTLVRCYSITAGKRAAHFKSRLSTVTATITTSETSLARSHYPREFTATTIDRTSEATCDEILISDSWRGCSCARVY